MLRMFKKLLLPCLLTMICLLLLFIQPRLIYGSSMEPTIRNGQLIIVSRYSKNVSRNDFWISEFNGSQSVKRIVGLPGEFIEVRGGTIYIDGIQEEPCFATPENWYEILLKEDEYFLVGDNRAHSSDSILFGPVHYTDLHGKVIYY